MQTFKGKNTFCVTFLNNLKLCRILESYFMHLKLLICIFPILRKIKRKYVGLVVLKVAVQLYIAMVL